MAASTSMASSPSRNTRMPLFNTAAAGLRFPAVGSGPPPEVSACHTMTKATRDAARIRPTAHGLVTLRQPARCNISPPYRYQPPTGRHTRPQRVELQALATQRVRTSQNFAHTGPSLCAPEVNDNDYHHHLVCCLATQSQDVAWIIDSTVDEYLPARERLQTYIGRRRARDAKAGI